MTDNLALQTLDAFFALQGYAFDKETGRITHGNESTILATVDLESVHFEGSQLMWSLCCEKPINFFISVEGNIGS